MWNTVGVNDSNKEQSIALSVNVLKLISSLEKLCAVRTNTIFNKQSICFKMIFFPKGCYAHNNSSCKHMWQVIVNDSKERQPICLRSGSVGLEYLKILNDVGVNEPVAQVILRTN